MKSIADILKELEKKAEESWIPSDSFYNGYIQALRDVQSVIDEERDKEVE